MESLLSLTVADLRWEIALAMLCVMLFIYRHILNSRKHLGTQRVRLHGLDTRADLNGFHATVLESSCESGVAAIKVKTLSETLSISVANATPTEIDENTIFSGDCFTVTKVAGRGYGLITRRKFARNELIFEEDPIIVQTISAEEESDDPQLVQLNDDAQTVIAIAQMRTGVRPEPSECSLLPGMKPISDRIFQYFAAISFSTLPPIDQRRWMDLSDSLTIHNASTKTPAGVLLSNSYCRASEGKRTHVLWELLSRANHSCCPNVDVQCDPDQGYHAKVIAAEDIDEGEELFMSYLGSAGSKSMERDTDARRVDLQRKFGFLCECRRCGPISQKLRENYERTARVCHEQDEQVRLEVEAFNAG